MKTDCFTFVNIPQRISAAPPSSGTLSGGAGVLRCGFLLNGEEQNRVKNPLFKKVLISRLHGST